jgi:uncharacterized protein YndB with AHSA1/START domain
MENEPVILERWYNAPVETIWKALTDKNEMKKWYFDLAEFKAEQGFEFSFLAGTEEKKFLHLCKVTTAIPNKKLSYTWRYDGFGGNSEVSFELFPEGEKTKLVLTHTGLETFPSDNPDFQKSNFVTGWTHFVNVALKDYLEKQV